MKKTDFIRAYYKLDSMESHIWDRWVDWRCKQAGINPRTDDYHSILSSIPEHFSWTPYREEGKVVITWDGGKKEIPLEEFVDDLDEQPKLTMLWHAGYYDGPLSGMADLDGEMVWFDLEEENDDRYRTFNLYRLTDEESEIHIRNHQEFRDKVGNHADYGDEFKPFGYNDEDRPAWCPAWVYMLWRRHQFNSFYRSSKKRKNVDVKGRQPFMVVDECQFDRRKTNV